MTRKHRSTRDRAKLFLAHGGKCHICGLKIRDGERWEASHPTPIELGGADDETNLAPAHYKCHRALTAEVDIPAIAKSNRVRARAIGAHRPRNPMPGSRASGLKKRMDGTVERRPTPERMNRNGE